MKKKGLVVVAPEVQGSSPDAIAKIVDEGKIEYTVTQGMRGPSLGRGIPHMAVFDVHGKLVFSGHPMDPEAEKSIKAALKEVEGGDEMSSGLAARPVRLVQHHLRQRRG